MASSLEARDRILSEHPWLTLKNQPMVIGTDFDALCSGLICHHLLGWYVVGFYDLRTLWFDPAHSPDLKRAVYVDLDISQSEIHSIGHHILKMRRGDKIECHCESVNPNLSFDIYLGNFKKKYPLGTVHLLSWLFGWSPPDTERAKYLFWHADSSWMNGLEGRYGWNVNDWLRERISVPSLAKSFAEVNTKEFEEGMKKHVHDPFTDIGVSGHGQVSSPFLGLRGRQTIGSPQAKSLVYNAVADIISGTFGLSGLSFPGNLLSVTGERAALTPKEVGNLDLFLASNSVFSYAVPGYREVNVTRNLHLP